MDPYQGMSPMKLQSRWLAVVFASVLLVSSCTTRDDETSTTQAPTPTAAEVEPEAEAPEPTEPDAEADAPEPTEPEAESDAPEPTEPEIPAETPEATDIGITETEIRVGVIADIDTPISPGLSQPLHDAVQAWVDTVNASGGVAGRQIVLTTYDSRLNPDESANMVLEACQNEFALIGAGMFVLLNPAPLIECADINGDQTGLPDISSLSISPGQGASPTTFSILVAGRDFTASEPTYNVVLYPADYVEAFLGDQTPKLLVTEPGTPGIRPGAVSTSNAYAQARGWETAGVMTVLDAAPQSEMIPVVNLIREQGVNVVYSVSISVAKVMAEARVQGVDVDSIAWICTQQCFSPFFANAFGEVADGLLTSPASLPWTDAEHPAIAQYLAAVDPMQISANGVLAFAAGKSFEELVATIVSEHGINGLTRASLLEHLRTGPEIAAAGIVGDGAVLGVPSRCWVTTQLVDGAYQRVDPASPGELNCDPDIVYQVVNPTE